MPNPTLFKVLVILCLFAGPQLGAFEARVVTTQSYLDGEISLAPGAILMCVVQVKGATVPKMRISSNRVKIASGSLPIFDSKSWTKEAELLVNGGHVAFWYRVGQGDKELVFKLFDGKSEARLKAPIQMLPEDRVVQPTEEALKKVALSEAPGAYLQRNFLASTSVRRDVGSAFTQKGSFEKVGESDTRFGTTRSTKVKTVGGIRRLEVVLPKSAGSQRKAALGARIEKHAKHPVEALRLFGIQEGLSIYQSIAATEEGDAPSNSYYHIYNGAPKGIVVMSVSVAEAEPNFVQGSAIYVEESQLIEGDYYWVRYRSVEFGIDGPEVSPSSESITSIEYQ